MEVGIAVEVRNFLFFKRGAYMHFLKFTQVCTKICIILTDLSCYKEYMLHHKVRYCICQSLMTVEYGLTAFMVWVIELYEEVIHLHKNLVSYFFSMEGGIRPWRLDFLPQINKHGLCVYQGPKSSQQEAYLMKMFHHSLYSKITLENRI